MRIDNAGNVGIGTSSPSFTLDTNGQIHGHYLWAGGVYDGRIYIRNAGNTVVTYLDGAAGANSYINNGGNVGIGTASPGAKLDISNGGNGGPIALNVAGSRYSAVVSTDYPATTANGTNYYRNIGFYSSNLPISTGVTDSGYRIGLDIENFVYDPNFLGTLASQFGLWARVGSYAAGNGTIQNSYGVYIDNLEGPATVVNKYGLFQANSTAKNYFAGNVGIGTTSPGSQFQVGDASGRAFKVNAGIPPFGTMLTGDAGGWAFGYSFQGHGGTNLGGFGAYGVNDALHNFYIGAYTSQLMTILAGGNVGIGTTTPGSTLTIAGQVSVTSGPVLVTASGDLSMGSFTAGPQPQ